ncbi:protein kinase [Grosmannia clavigera kw1407]|uniref:cyclin-dependent kinase n=1 Tax=Grosmannia clavigera (strain kw1407 / UAMH 11150) TaxID=655863 RepID=F0XUP9_GROCL|nr:protein kinase [Grosmannia clavigera kw1407]EFW98784.1 protein kinase [Grosmannia clavigera kw1407]
MASAAKSRWADADEDAALEAQRRREKEAKRRARAAERALKQEEAVDSGDGRRSKRRRTTTDDTGGSPPHEQTTGDGLLRLAGGTLTEPCGSVEAYEKLNDIEEGAYGWVARARHAASGEVVALKRLKLDAADRGGLPVTGLREIQLLRDCTQENIVRLRAVVVGEGGNDAEQQQPIFLVLDFVEHDLRTILEDMPQPFLASEGRNEADQLVRIFDLCGLPTDTSWPGFRRLPNARALKLPPSTAAASTSSFRSRFPLLTTAGCQLLGSLLALDPARRPSARQMLDHDYFRQDPRAKPEAMFPTFPSKAGQERRRRRNTPNAPVRGALAATDLDLGAVDFAGIFAARDKEERGAGFSLRMV